MQDIRYGLEITTQNFVHIGSDLDTDTVLFCWIFIYYYFFSGKNQFLFFVAVNNLDRNREIAKKIDSLKND